VLTNGFMFPKPFVSDPITILFKSLQKLLNMKVDWLRKMTNLVLISLCILFNLYNIIF